MTLSSIEGITLTSFPLKESSKIVKVYTNERGLLSFVTNHISKKNTDMIAFCAPCTQSEIIYVDKNRELFNVKEVTIKNLNLPLRASFEKIETAIEIIKSIISSQVQDKPNAVLFNMIVKYLHKLSSATRPYSYLCSFQLKLLLLEGWLHLSDKCSTCSKDATYIVKGDYFCANHAKDQKIAFDTYELKNLALLAKATKFTDIDNIKVSNCLKQKIQKLFSDILN